ncbi:SAV_915 family protein [Rhodococcus marinonascens]|uniref:SAV_915 family protein n=1 Tax=Rhodococcus marinonascens TaxID=38311 RepID=UPI000932B9AB|nr:SAV_915 family protein [Rhodococcus marinonascens]
MVDQSRRAEGLLYVPTLPRTGSGQVQLELRTLPDGRLALPAYTSRIQLTKCCGDGQPWGAVNSEGLDEIQRSTGCDVVLLDAEMPAGSRRESAPYDPYEEDLDSHIPTSFLQEPYGTGRTRGNGR